MLAFVYTRRNNEIVRCIHLLMCLRYSLKSSKKIRNHFVQEIICNKEVEITSQDNLQIVKIEINLFMG
ncbi:hypothetical protein NUSPORA_02975 [Nucleospora cyclopteri]